MCKALAAGTGFPLVPPAPLREGGVALYGFLRGLLPTLREAQAQGRAWVYADRGYLRRTDGEDYSGYFRLTRNAWQCTGFGDAADLRRWTRLQLEIRPWRRGRHVVVCPPGDVFTNAVGGFAADTWLRGTLAVLRAHTDRELRVRPKVDAQRRPLAADLEGAHALVTYMSNTAVEAALAGTPVFCTGPSAAAAIGLSDLTQIESPRYADDRERWARVLADNQWTLAEIARGIATERLFG